MSSGRADEREVRRARILAAAKLVFSRGPFSGASMDDIAAEAGFGKPTLYRYFPGKDALFAAVFAAVLDDLERQLDRALSTEGRTRDCLRAMVSAIVPAFREHLVPLRYLGEGEAAADQSRRRVFRERRVRIAGRLAAALDRGVERGEVRPVPTLPVAQMALGMVWSATAATGASDREIAALLSDLLLDGVAAPARRSDPVRPARRPAALALKATA